ncbi:MAG TPA: desulfoferrodoxin [Clostridiaceae bacterium]|nr:desulfoferrodoxin [Clostridiaceae bacterium]
MKVNSDFYKCSVCGNLIGKIEDSGVEIVCCDKPMEKLVANTVDASKEKHVPVAEVDGDKITVKVGSVAHPMVEEHYIQWICVICSDRVQKVRLSPGQEPTATFIVPESGEVEIYEYCNLHGLWKTTITK